MTIMVIITQRVNDALKAKLKPEGRQMLAQASAKGATISVLSPNQIKDAILTSLQNGCPVVALVSEGQAAADFQKDIEETLKENMRMVSIFRVVTTPVAHSPDVSCENIIDIAEVPTKVANAIVAFTRMMEEQENKEIAVVSGPPTVVSQEENGEQVKREEIAVSGEGEQGGSEKAQKERHGFSWWLRRKGGEPERREASRVEEQKKDTSAPPPSLPPSPSQQVSSPPPPVSSRQEKRAVVLRFSEFFVCALDEEISQAQKILSQKYRLPVRLVKLQMYQIPMTGVSAEQILVVATKRNVGEARWPAMFILAEDLTPEEAAKYLPDTSKIVAQFVPRKKIPDSIVKAVIRIAIEGEINLEAL